jgi:hypothetical protein
MRVSRLLRVALVAMSLILCCATPAAGAKPSVERVPLNLSGIFQPQLSAFCGFDIWADVSGHFQFRVFSDNAGNPTREIDNYALRIQWYTSGDASLATVFVGPDRVTFNDDGSLDVFLTGNRESLHGPGIGSAYQSVGWTHVHVTFDTDGNQLEELVSVVGQHDADNVRDSAICALLS